jgi:hypothetical protein
MMLYAHLGQAAQCPQSSVLPRDYLSSTDEAYLPGIAPEPPSSPAPPSQSWLLPVAVGTVVLAWWLISRSNPP